MDPQRTEPPPEGRLISEALRRSGLSARKAAKLAGISEGWWRQVVRGYQTLSGGGQGPVRGPAETVARMALVVGVTAEQLEQAGRDDAAAELRTLAEAAEHAATHPAPDDDPLYRGIATLFEALTPDQQMAYLRRLREDLEAQRDSKSPGGQQPKRAG